MAFYNKSSSSPMLVQMLSIKRSYLNVIDSTHGTNIHKQYKLVEINHTRKYPKYDPFILASQVQQVYFTPYPSTKRDKNAW